MGGCWFAGGFLAMRPRRRRWLFFCSLLLGSLTLFCLLVLPRWPADTSADRIDALHQPFDPASSIRQTGANADNGRLQAHPAVTGGGGATNGGQSVFLLVTVQSAPGHFVERMACRRTWARFARDSLRWAAGPCQVLFVVGRAPSTSVENALALEQAQFGDLVRLHEVVESYDQLTRKTLATILWLAAHSGGGQGDGDATTGPLAFDFWLKTDDDSFVRLDRLSLQLQTALRTVHDDNAVNDGPLLAYWGFFNLGAQPIRNASHKWYDPEFSGSSYYPPYALGTAYALSRDAVQYVAQLHRAATLPLYAMEDVSVAVWLSQELHQKLAPAAASRNSGEFPPAPRVVRLEALWDLIPYVQSAGAAVAVASPEPGKGEGAPDQTSDDVCEESLIVRSHCPSEVEMYRLWANYQACGHVCHCCLALTPSQRFKLRWKARKALAQWYSEERVRRRQREQKMYARHYHALANYRVIPCLPIEDPLEWNKTRINL